MNHGTQASRRAPTTSSGSARRRFAGTRKRKPAASRGRCGPVARRLRVGPARGGPSRTRRRRLGSALGPSSRRARRCRKRRVSKGALQGASRPGRARGPLAERPRNARQPTPHSSGTPMSPSLPAGRTPRPALASDTCPRRCARRARRSRARAAPARSQRLGRPLSAARRPARILELRTYVRRLQKVADGTFRWATRNTPSGSRSSEPAGGRCASPVPAARTCIRCGLRITTHPGELHQVWLTDHHTPRSKSVPWGEVTGLSTQKLRAIDGSAAPPRSPDAPVHTRNTERSSGTRVATNPEPGEALLHPARSLENRCAQTQLAPDSRAQLLVRGPARPGGLTPIPEPSSSFEDPLAQAGQPRFPSPGLSTQGRHQTAAPGRAPAPHASPCENRRQPDTPRSRSFRISQGCPSRPLRANRAACDRHRVDRVVATSLHASRRREAAGSP